MSNDSDIEKELGARPHDAFSSWNYPDAFAQVTVSEQPGPDEEKAGVVGGDVGIKGLGGSGDESGVKRRLKQRHLSMIALGGTIGTGLFVGVGGALAQAGPLNTLMGYSIMGAVVWSMMVALGEMATLFPVAGGFTHYATRFIDPSIGFAMGWNYWYSYAITIPTEVVAAAIVIQYWDVNQTINPAAWITIMLVLVFVINFFGVRWYGEAEFWFSSIKIITVIGLILLGLIIDLGGGPNHDRLGFRYWKHPGPMAQMDYQIDGQGNIIDPGIPGAKGRFLSFWNVFVQAAFSFAGTEIIGVTVGEAENPRKAVPKAIKRVFWRILLFYVLSIFFVGLLVPYTDPRLLSNTSTASASPFVIAIQDAGIKVLPHIVNGVLLITAWSAANSDMYVYALALEDKAPRLLRYCTKGGLPVWSLAFTGSIGLLAYMQCGAATAVTVFGYLYAISSISAIIAWLVILGSYIRFYHGLQYHGINRDTLPYKAPLQPYASYFGFFFLILVILFSGFTVFLQGRWNTATFVCTYITIPLFIVAWLGWKVWKRTKLVSLAEMDFDTGRRKLDEEEEEEEKKKRRDDVEEVERRGVLRRKSLVRRFFDWLL